MEIPYEVTPRRDTGLYNAKLGVWLFLASEVMLFGGLFSAYVFLRVGVQDGLDNPWPWGINVHKDFVWLGFVNTLVLIASSVGVVFAWVALKERNWRRYQVYMYSVVACAVVFMAIKTVEYNSKLNHHHGIKLVDNSVMEGRIVGDTDKVRFEGNSVRLSLQGSLPFFLKDLDSGSFPTFTVSAGRGEGGDAEIASRSEFKSWFHKNRRAVASEITAERKRYRSELEAGNPAPLSVETTVTLTAEEPFRIEASPRRIAGHSDSNLSYRDGPRIEGELIGDDVEFEVHEVDMQLVLPQKQRESIVWDVIGDESAKREFFAAQLKEYEKMKDYYESKPIPEKMLRGHVLNLQNVHVGGHGGAHGEEDHSGEAPAGEAEAEDDHGDEHTITVPRDQIKFMGNHGPRYGNYYALYFTMTALHGLHVVGGALVLLFFVVFGKKLYLKNPEHLANRVEVGGLFWHFVDLIWIFLFPLMYLL
ncbi:MAG: cytochrome c oxidase subunit 3 [Verrucomicrobiales bacterium]